MMIASARPRSSSKPTISRSGSLDIRYERVVGDRPEPQKPRALLATNRPVRPAPAIPSVCPRSRRSEPVIERSPFGQPPAAVAVANGRIRRSRGEQQG